MTRLSLTTWRQTVLEGTALLAVGMFLAFPAFAQSAGPLTPSAGVSDGSVTGSVWGFPEEAAVSDDVYAVSPISGASNTEFLKVTGFGFALPPTATIRGIQATIEKRSVLGLTRDNAVRSVKGGVIGSTDRSDVTPWPTSDAATTHGGTSDLWGDTWTAGDINDPGFGLAISARDGGLDVAAIDQIIVEVFYSLCGDDLISSGEQCDDGNTAAGDCCSPTCQFEPATTVCRAAAGECDTAETCSGTSATCPVDVVVPSGSPCSDDGDTCTSDACDANGNCVHSGVASPECQYKPGKLVIVKPARLAKFLSKDNFGLPNGANDPTMTGASIRFLDTAFGGAGDVTFALPATGWKGLGSPPGSKGFKYKGTGTQNDPCKSVLIKPTAVKAVCKGAGVTLTPPFLASAGIALDVGTTPIRYCAEFDASTDVSNSADLLKRTNAPAPPQCPEIQPTPTAVLPTATPTFTKTPSPTRTATPTITPTRTDTFTPGPSPTPTNTSPVTATPTRTPTPTPGGSVCGNGLLEPGEFCQTCPPMQSCVICPADCAVLPCTNPGNPLRTFRVNFTSPPFQDATSTTVRVAYRSNLVSIPGSGNAMTVAGRITMPQSSTTITPNDLDSHLVVVYSRAAGINPVLRLFNIAFDSCQGAPAPVLADFACTVLGCSNVNGDIPGCTCAIATP